MKPCKFKTPDLDGGCAQSSMSIWTEYMLHVPRGTRPEVKGMLVTELKEMYVHVQDEELMGCVSFLDNGKHMHVFGYVRMICKQFGLPKPWVVEYYHGGMESMMTEYVDEADSDDE